MMDVPQRSTKLRHLGYNVQTNDSERFQSAGRASASTRNCLSSQVQGSMQGQLERKPPTQVPRNTCYDASVTCPDSCVAGRTTGGNIPRSTACISRHSTFRNDVSCEDRGREQVRTQLPSRGICATTHRPVCADGFPDGGKCGQRADEGVFAQQSSHLEGAFGFRTIGEHDKASDVGNTTRFQKGCYGEKSSDSLNYINPKLVKKVLDCQKKRAQTPVTHLQNCNREVPLVSAGRRITRLDKPEHHSSDTSLCNRVADCRVTDPETVSTGSQKESGYQSGDSVGDRSSENSELGRNMRWPTAVQPFPAVPGAPDDVCGHYFLKGDSLMDLCNEQERSGNWQQALNFLNQAIECFQQATNVPGVSHDIVLRMRLKHNRAVLHRRKLLKQSICSTEAPTRRLPCTPQDVKESSTVEVPSKLHRPICDQFEKAPIGLYCGDDVRNRGISFGRGPSFNSVDAAGNVDSVGNGDTENASLGVVDPGLPESGLQWTSDDVKDIKIYATLPKNRRRNGHLVTNTPTINPVETKLRSEILTVCHSEEFPHPITARSQARNASGYRAIDGYSCQEVPNQNKDSGVMRARESVPEKLRVKGNPSVAERAQLVPCSDDPRLHYSQSHNFRYDNVNVRKMDGSAPNHIKFVRF